MDDPIGRQDGDRFLSLWPTTGIGIALDHLKESSEGLHGEISVQTINGDGKNTGHIHWARINLSSTTARTSLAKFLSTRMAHGTMDWPSMVEYACTWTAQRFRAPSPICDLSSVPAMTMTGFAVTPFLPLGETTIFYGDGDSGKSLLALLLCCAVSLKHPLPGGIRPFVSGPCLYYDYETSAQDQALRLTMLARGLGHAEAPTLAYRRMSRPFADETAMIRRDVAEHRPVLLVVDSIAPACQGEIEKTAEPVLRFMNALREVAPTVTKLVISHVSKSDSEKKRARPYGSVFVRNMARACWEIRRSHEEDTDRLTMGLFHDKANTGRRHRPFGLTFSWEAAGMIVCKGTDLSDSEELSQSLSLPIRLRQELKSGEKTVRILAEELDAPEKSVYRALTRMPDAIRLDEGLRGRGRTSTWGLKSEREQEKVR